MKKIFILIFITFLFNTIQSQTYHPMVIPNASWNEVYTHWPNGWGPPQYSYNHFSIYDTVGIVKNQKRYCVIYCSFNQCYAYIREDSTKKVYFYQPLQNAHIVDTSEILLYDFNMHIGDTLLTRVYSSNNCVNIVTNIDSILILGEYRKRFHVSRNGNNPLFFWIEGIGSNIGLLGNWIMPFEAMNELICYSVNDTTYYLSPKFISCKGYLGIDEINTITPKIFPNPVTDFIQIENITDKTIAEIYSMDGKLQKSVILTDKATINIKDLYKGIYIIKLNSEKGNTFYKFIKQ